MGPGDFQVHDIHQNFVEKAADDDLELDGAGHSEEVNFELLCYLQLKVGPSQERFL